jgi:hypothetical protein
MFRGFYDAKVSANDASNHASQAPYLSTPYVLRPAGFNVALLFKSNDKSGIFVSKLSVLHTHQFQQGTLIARARRGA